jgi:hypothetical protein
MSDTLSILRAICDKYESYILKKYKTKINFYDKAPYEYSYETFLKELAKNLEFIGRGRC